jgi:hypothetical protein
MEHLPRVLPAVVIVSQKDMGRRVRLTRQSGRSRKELVDPRDNTWFAQFCRQLLS